MTTYVNIATGRISVTRVEKPRTPEQAVKVSLRVTTDQAAKLEKVKVAIIGVGARGSGHASQLAVIEGVLRGIRPSLGWFLLGDNIAVVVNGSGLSIGDGTLTATRGAVTVAAYSLGLLALAVVWFRTRDVQ